MNACRNLKYLELRNLILVALLMLTACSKDKVESLDAPTKELISNRIDSGQLLLSFSQDNNNYILKFEKESITLPFLEVTELISDLDHWKTKITFVDGSKLEVPTQGTSLDFMIEKTQLDPSGINPLAALVDLWLPTYGRVKVTVHGKNGPQGNITHLLQETTPRQRVPILGLYPDYNNVVDLAFTDMEGKVRGSTRINIQTNAIAIADFPKWKLLKSSIAKIEPGINLINYPGMSEADASLPYMIDNEGELRWVLDLKKSAELQHLSISVGLKRTKQGTYIAGDQAKPRIVEIDVFGNLIRQWDLEQKGYKFHHEVTESQDGNFLVAVTKTSARLRNGEPRVNDFIIELDPKTNKVLNEWDLAKQLDTSRYEKPDGITPPEFSQSPNNWAHNNSIGEIGQDLLATVRYQGIISYTHAGNLKWIVSPHKFWSSNHKPFLLSPISENGTLITDPAVINGDARIDGFDWAWGPHTPVALSETNFLVFDNGYNRNWIPNFSGTTKNYSRVVEYKIDLTNKTVQQLWSFGESMGVNGFAQAVSGVQFLHQTGNVLFCPGMGVITSIGTGGRIVEINPKTKEILYELEIASNSGFAFHRVTRLPIYPENM